MKHLKHLKHLMWMPGLLFCKHFKELGGKIKDGVHKRQDQKGMLLFMGVDRRYRRYSGYGLLGLWACWDGREQKVGVDVF